MDLVGLVTGSGWASGVNLYAVVALLGILGRTVEGSPVPDELTSTVVIGGALALYAVEFVVDKIPYLDNAWDAAHTIIRPAGATALGWMLTADEASVRQLFGAGGSGVLAFAAHTAKATTRAAINTSPEPASNVLVSLLEDGLVGTVVWFAVERPVVALVLVVVLLIAGGVLTVVLWKAARRLAGSIRERIRARRRPAEPERGQSRPGTW